jgi:hypothetical protein
MTKEVGINAITEVFSNDEKQMDVVMRRIAIKSATIQKMKKISSLFGDEMGNDVKEVEMISFFVETAFNSFLKSGEIDKRVKALTNGD